MCDLSDWKQTAQVASDIAKQIDRIDIFINNAARGIMTQQLTDYGVDRHMALNHMGHVVSTSHLLPVLKKTASHGNTVRIVNLASNAIEQVPKNINYDNLDSINTTNAQYPSTADPSWPFYYTPDASLAICQTKTTPTSSPTARTPVSWTRR